VKELPVSQLVSLRKAKAGHQTAELLKLRRGRSHYVFRLRNILRVSGQPVVVSDITIPASLFPRMSKQVVREGGATLYAVYQSHYEINIIRTVEQLRAIKADGYVASLFCLRAADPILEIQRIAYTFNDVPVEIRRSRVLTNNYHYLLDQGETS
jgi:GntR family transcriptional regulator